MRDLVLIDTDTMPLEDVAGHPGSKRQMLLSGDDMAGFVQITYGPPGFTGRLQELMSHGPHRHYHRTVNERHYVLGGDFPIWHWNDPAGEGALTRLRRHHYLENVPETLHGITPDVTPDAGWKILQWTNGYGTEIYEPGAAEETFEVPFDQEPPAIGYHAPILIDARTPAWQPLAKRPGWSVAPLATYAPGSPPVALVNIPAGATTAAAAEIVVDADLPWLFVVSGDLQLERAAQPMPLTEGMFLAWRERGLALTAGRVSTAGCVALCVGHRL